VQPHILCKHKLLFWMRLIAINCLTALKSKSCSASKNNLYEVHYLAVILQ